MLRDSLRSEWREGWGRSFQKEAQQEETSLEPWGLCTNQRKALLGPRNKLRLCLKTFLGGVEGQEAEGS